MEHAPRARLRTVTLLVAERVRLLRQSRGISQSHLARTCGIAKSTLSQLEAGQSNPTLSTLVALAAALDVAVDDLVAEEGSATEVAPPSRTREVAPLPGGGSYG